MRFWKLFLPLLASTLCFAAQPDRILGPIDSSHTVPLLGNVHAFAVPEFDLGRADGSRTMSAASLVFKPSPAQQAALNKLLAGQQNPASPNYHKWLTPAQFADRFGMSRNDVDKVTSWLQSQGLTVTHVANSRNQIFFEGAAAQIEAAFHTEIHNYLVEGEVHYANATAPSVPAALSGIALAVQNLHNFQPKPRAIIRKIPALENSPHFTSVVSGDHFVAPGDFATIYDVGPLYTGGNDGAGQTIALTGQSSINLPDVSNFRSAAGLPAKAPTLLLVSGTSTRCSGDEGESDLDVEWSGAVAKNASIILVYEGLLTGDSCTNRQRGAFDALQYAIDNTVAPIISNSYGNCESAIGSAFANTMRGWVQQANSQGQTVISASGDSGAADCDYRVKIASHGLAVDIPAAIPEVTGMGGTEFNGDAEATVVNGNATATQYWSGTTGGTDTISSALSYIPEMAWNDTTNTLNDGEIIASGGGASTFFLKPSWQTGTGVPADGKRDVPDLALNASPIHDPYLFCSEDDGKGAIIPSCTAGFRVGAGGSLSAVGGTSAAAPTFAGILALVDQYLGSSGLGLINPTLYSLAASSPTAFHDTPAGTSNIVPCAPGSTGCPAVAPFQYGFNTGTGYDQVTGLGSVDANELAIAWAASLAPDFQLAASALAPTTIPAGQSASATVTISAITGSVPMVVNFAPSSCTGLPTGATCSFNPPSVTFDGTDPVTTVVTISTSANMAPVGPVTITIKPTNSSQTTAIISLTVTATNEAFTLTTTAATFPVAVGGTAQINLTVMGTGSPANFVTNNTTALPLTYSCSGIPSTAEISCQLPNNGQPTNAATVTLNLVTTSPTARLQPSPLGHMRIFYAMLLPGWFGLVFAAGSRPGSKLGSKPGSKPGSRPRHLRMLGLMVLAFSTLWLGACGGNNSNSSLKNPGTPGGMYSVTITATTSALTGGTALSASVPITLNVTQ